MNHPTKSRRTWSRGFTKHLQLGDLMFRLVILLVIAGTIGYCQSPSQPLAQSHHRSSERSPSQLSATSPIVSPAGEGATSLGGGDRSGQTTPKSPIPIGMLGGSFLAKNEGKSDSAGRTGAAGEMLGFSSTDGSGSQTITLVHTGKSWMAVYHIDRSGAIRLISSRPLAADFTLQLNATSPLPSEIREMVGKAR